MKNNKFVTYTGLEVDFDNFTADMVCLEDIAHHLTNINRYGGVLPLDVHYSVAQHSLELVNYLNAGCLFGTTYMKQMALLHDASETYLGDVIWCLKDKLEDYLLLERQIQDAIYCKYLGEIMGEFKIFRYPQIIAMLSDLDKKIVHDEMFGLGLINEYDSTKALDVRIKPQTKELVKQSFLYCAAWLGLQD